MRERLPEPGDPPSLLINGNKKRGCSGEVLKRARQGYDIVKRTDIPLEEDDTAYTVFDDEIGKLLVAGVSLKAHHEELSDLSCYVHTRCCGSIMSRTPSPRRIKPRKKRTISYQE